MGLIKQIPTFVAGVRCDAEAPNESNLVKSFIDPNLTIPSSVTTSSQLREALRFADQAQEKLYKTTLKERTEVVKLVLREAAEHREEMAWGLAKFRGLVAKDAHWMCDLLIAWSEQVDELVGAIWGFGSSGQQRIQYKNRTVGLLEFRSRGKGALISSSTMDGPPAIAAISHAILSGTHMIVRPSWKDVATHYMFEVLYKHKLHDFIQMVRWPSAGGDTMSLNQQLIQNVDQAIVFASDKTFEELISGFEEQNRLRLGQKIQKYGTGLPLVIVTENTDLNRAAELTFLGARRGNGKFCLSHSPVLVHQSVYKSLLDKFVSLSSNLKAGDLLNRDVERGCWEKDDLQGLSRLASRFGGKIVQGTFGETSMDVVILEDVPPNSPCLYQEFPGTLLALIPYSTREEAVSIAQKFIGERGREAWTAVNVFSNDEEYKEFANRIDSYHFLRGGITSEPKFLLPHQGRYFAFDLTRRLTTEE